MKKVMIGILILIPVLILVIVAAVSNFLKIAAWIAVDDISVVYKDDQNQEADSITLVFDSKVSLYDMNDFVKVKVFPEYANRYSIEWRISGDVECIDKEYEKLYNEYRAELDVYNKYLSDIGAIDERIRILTEESEREKKLLDSTIASIKADKILTASQKNAKIAEAQEKYDTEQRERDAKIKAANEQKNSIKRPELGAEVEPAAMFVDESGKEVTSNTSGKLKINSYCRFTVVVQVENVSRTLSVTALGYNVDSISIVNIGEDDNKLTVGERMIVDAKYNPISSIVTKTRWHSDNPSVAYVDQNGVITAVGKGKANITVEANRYDEQDVFVKSEIYTVEVSEGASKFGAEFTTSKASFTLTQVGIAIKDVDVSKSDGCTISGDIVKLTDTVAHIVTAKGTVTVNRCADDDIIIENASVYNAVSGYVFAVSELTLKLKAVWADALKEGAPENVVWSAESDSNIASVNGGEVTASGSGIVKIIAQCNGKSTSIVLNLQLKLVSMKLRTDNAYFRVGLAQETVFAAEKFSYIDVRSNPEKESNSVLLRIIGEPKRTDEDTDATFNTKLYVFYSAFTYEITEGKEYAHFADGAEPNRLVFNPEKLEGKGKQTIKVLVRAKYPRYESEATLIQDEVDIKVIYGVEVNNIAELRQAADDQKTYARADGNLQPREQVWEHTNTSDGRADKYKVFEAEHSLSTYGISLMTDIAFEILEDGTPLKITDGNQIKIYGDVYGNGHIFSAERDQVEGVNGMLRIAWSHVTVSNIGIRANRMDKDGTLSTDETSGLQGECVQIYQSDDQWRNRIVGIRIEFSILENARRAGLIYNGDCVLDGLVVRNIDSTAFYNPARMYVYEEEGELVTYPMYPHLTINNCVYSNCIQTIGSYPYERFTVVPASGDAGNLFPDCKVGDGRFIRKDKVKNAEYFKKYFASAGINIQIRQTGFLDIYNWQNVKNASLIDVGDPETNKRIASFAGEIIKQNPAFEDCRYEDKEENAMYLHMGFMSTGISFGQGIMDEPSYLDVTFEDKRFAEPVRTREIPLVIKDNILIGAAEKIIKTFEIVFYCYSTELSDITPDSRFEITNSFISRLHGSNK